MHGGNDNCIEVQSENLIGRENYLTKLELNERHMLKCVLKTMVESVLFECNWLSIGYIGGFLWKTKMGLVFP